MPSKLVKNRSKLKTKVLPANVQQTKPSIKSKVLKDYILSLLPDEKPEGKSVEQSEILPELIKSILTGDEVSIKDHYSALVTYLVLNKKDVSHDKFVGAYESVRLECESKHGVCCALPYGALIASGIILKWESEQQNQIVSKMLKIYKNEPESKNVVFYFLIALDSHVKLSCHQLKKVSIDSRIQLYFMLSVDSKQDCKSVKTSMFNPANILDLVDVYLQEPEDKELDKNVSTLLARKLLSLGSDNIMKFWEKLIVSFLDPRTDYRELVVLQLLSSILENYKEHNFEINQLFPPSIIKILSKSSPKIEPVFKSINSSLKNLSQNLSSNDKLTIIDSIVVNTDKYLEKSMVVKICDTLVANMSFEEISQVTELYRKVIMGEKHKAIKQKKMDNEFNDFEKIYCTRFFGKLISLNSCKYHVDWRKNQLKFLFKIGFLSEHKDLITNHLAGLARKIFYSSLNQKFAKLSDLDTILKKLVKLAGEKVNNKEENFVIPFKDKAYDLWFKTLNVLKKLKDSDNADKLVFKVLLRYMMLFMFCNYQTAKGTLDELFKVIENKDLNSGELHWSEVTVDMFLHLLSGNDNTHKNVIHSTFSHVCKHMTSKGLDLILSAVKGKETTDEEMSVDGDEDSEGDSDDSEGEGDDSKGEGEESNEGSDDEEEKESKAEDVDSDESMEENEGQIDKLKDALRQELFKIDTASTCGSIDLDDLNEEEGKHLNATLGEIFKEQHSKYKSSTKNKMDSLEVHFRIRAINLLEIYIENNPSLYCSTVILTSIISLLKMSIPNHTLAPFTVSLKRCLKKLTDLKEFSDCDCVTETSICSILNQILLRDCPMSVYQDMTEQIVDCCLFLIKSSALLTESNNEMTEHIKSIIKDYFKDADSHVPFLLFTSIFSSLTLEKLIGFIFDVIKFAFSDKTKYHKRSQALQLLITFYNYNRLFKDVSGFEESLVKIESKILKKSLKVVSNTTDCSEMNKKYGCMFLDLLCLVKTKNKSITNEPGPHWDMVTEIINKISEVPVFQKELNVTFVNFCKIFNFELMKTDIKSPVNGYPAKKQKKKRKLSVAKLNDQDSISPKNRKKKNKKKTS